MGWCVASLDIDGGEGEDILLGSATLERLMGKICGLTCHMIISIYTINEEQIEVKKSPTILALAAHNMPTESNLQSRRQPMTVMFSNQIYIPSVPPTNCMAMTPSRDEIQGRIPMKSDMDIQLNTILDVAKQKIITRWELDSNI